MDLGMTLMVKIILNIFFTFMAYHHNNTCFIILYKYANATAQSNFLRETMNSCSGPPPAPSLTISQSPRRVY